MPPAVAVRPDSRAENADPAFFAAIRSAALGWWGAHGRALNFRQSRDPYGVLVSEVIAQQTQITRVAPAWDAFMARFPTVRALAAASSADVLRQWQGLGYNRRALNLWKAARAVVDEHDGVVPTDVAALERLPGIGPYTARAVAAIAFSVPVGAVDTNVRRVLGRVVLGEVEAAAGPAIQDVADELVPDDAAAAWTHALMDIGAAFCRPRSPRCDSCPLNAVCRFRAELGGIVGWAAPRPTDGAARPPFRTTTRWLRGRLLDLARATPDDGWFRVDGPLGDHEPAAIQSAVRAMASEGLLELHPAQPALARLPR